MNRVMYLGSGLSYRELIEDEPAYQYVMENIDQFIFNIVPPVAMGDLAARDKVNIQYIPWDVWNPPGTGNRVPGDGEWCISYDVYLEWYERAEDNQLFRRPAYTGQKLAPWENWEYVRTLLRAIRQHAIRWGPKGEGFIHGYCFEGLYDDPMYMWGHRVQRHPDQYDREKWKINTHRFLAAVRNITIRNNMLMFGGGSQYAINNHHIRRCFDGIKVENPDGYLRHTARQGGSEWDYLYGTGPVSEIVGGLQWYNRNLNKPIQPTFSLKNSWIEIVRGDDPDLIWFQHYTKWARIAEEYGMGVCWAPPYGQHPHDHIPILPMEEHP